MQQVAATHHIPHSCLKSWGKLDEYLAPNGASFRSAPKLTKTFSKPHYQPSTVILYASRMTTVPNAVQADIA